MHTLIIGRTGAGKSFIASKISIGAKERGRRRILYDPLGNRFPCDIRCTTADELLEACKANRDCVVFIDESPTICNNLGANKKCEWLVTMSRHQGHKVYLLAQDATQLAPIYRRNCTELFLFSVAPACARLLASEFGSDTLATAHTLPARHYFYHRPFDAKGRPFQTVFCKPVK